MTVQSLSSFINSIFLKKAGYIFLFILLGLQSGGVFVYYGIKQYFVKQEMLEVVLADNTKFETITLTISEFQKSKISQNEIMLNGKMFDISSVKIDGKNIELVVVHDIDEEDVLAQINQSITNSKDQNSNQENQLVKLLTAVYLSPSQTTSVSNEGFQQISFQQIIEIIPSHILEISSPPPRIS